MHVRRFVRSAAPGLLVVVAACASASRPTDGPREPSAGAGGGGQGGGAAGTPPLANGRFRFPGPRTALDEPVAVEARRQLFLDSQAGDDTRDGLAEDRAWKTLAPLARAALQPGDVVSFKRGSSWAGGLLIRDSGAADHPIVFRAYGTGAAPSFANTGAPWLSAIKVQGSWITIDGLLVRDATEAGVYVDKPASHVVVRNVEATAVGIGVQLNGADGLVAGVYAHDLHMVVDTPGGDDDFGAVGFQVSGPRNEIAYSRCERCRAPSQDYGFDGGVIELYGDVTGTTIHHVWGEASDGFVEIGGGAIADTVLAYNVSLRNFGAFACLHTGGKFGAAISAFAIEQNTIITDDVGSGIIRCIDAAASVAGVTFRNNVVASSRQKIAERVMPPHGHNLYTLGADVPLGFELAADEAMGDPRFEDLSTGKLVPLAGSPAAGRGQPLGYARDFADVSVPVPPDLGAFVVRR